MNRLRVGIAGLGIGWLHGHRFRECERAEVAALCDVNEDRLHSAAANLCVTRCYTSYHEFTRDPDVDAVVVATPNHLHASQTEAALRAGKHVLVEKPMGLNAREARAMVDVANSVGRVLSVNMVFRLHPAVRSVQAMVGAGRLGDIYHARTWWHRNRGIPALGGWFTQRAESGGGALIDLGVHRLDLAWWLMGRPRPVSACAVAHDRLGRAAGEAQGRRFDVEDLMAGLVRFVNGASLSIEASWATNSASAEDMQLHLYGTAGGAVIRNTDDGYQFEAQVFLSTGDAVERLHPGWPERVSLQDQFCRHVQDGAPNPAPGADGVVVMQMIDALYRSARTGQEESVGDL